MEKISICKKIGMDLINIKLSFGHAYIVFSSLKDIQEQLFKGLNMNKSFINSPFNDAIKIPDYVNKNKITTSKIENLKKQFNIPFLDIDEDGLYNQIIYVTLNRLLINDAIIIETTGLAKHSIEYLLNFCLRFLEVNKTKMFVIIQNENIGIKYPRFKIEQLNQLQITNFDNWFNSNKIYE